MSSVSAMTERDLQATIVAAARTRGMLAYHAYDSRRSEPGWPDLVLCDPPSGRLLFVACKTDDGRVTDA